MRLRIGLLFAVLTAAASAIGAMAYAQPNQPVPARAEKNLQAARRDARRLLAKVSLPAGAVVAAEDPSSGHALAKVETYPVTPALIDVRRFWVVPEAPGPLIAWLRGHRPAGSTLNETEGPGCCTPELEATSLGFEFPAVAGVLESRELLVTVANAPGGKAAVRADAQDIYWVPRPRWEKVPAGVHQLDLRVVRLNEFTGKTSTSNYTVSAARTISRIVSMVDALPAGQPGTEACPADVGPTVTVEFLPAEGRVPLATVVADGSGCGGVSFTLRGKSAPGLSGGPAFDQRLGRMLRFKG
jgi:hypothetical protein